MVDKMTNLDRRLGPWTGRVWGLILNFIGNGLAIYGAIGVVCDGSRMPMLILGLVLTIGCILMLARPCIPKKNTWSTDEKP